MENVYIKETEKEYKLPWFLLKKNRFLQQGDICIYEVPIMKRKKNYLKVCKYLKNKGVKNVYFSKLTDSVLSYDLKTEFQYIYGENNFYNNFVSVLEFFAQKKGIPLKESTVAFISDDVKKTEQLLLKIYKKIKKIVVYTRNVDKFKYLSSKFRTEYGIDIDVRKKEIKPKKYRHIYINTEKERIMEKSLFKNCFCIDIYKIYQNSYNDVVFHYKTPFDSFLKEHKIEKRLSFSAYYLKNTAKDYKIINIIKL